MTVILNQSIYVLITIGMAIYHSVLIKRNKPIKHGLWSAIALAVAGLFGLINIWYIPVMIFLRAMVFNGALNYFRHLPFLYTSPTSTSILDKLERKYLPGWDRYLAYGILLLFSEVMLYSHL